MAIGTSTGEEYPSKLEEVLSNLDTSGSTKAPLAPRNTPMDQFRDENDMDLNSPGTDMRRRTMVAQAGPNNKDTTPLPDTRPDLYLDENGQQRSRKNDSVLEQFNPFVDKLAKGLSQSDVDLIDKYHGFESTHGKWTDEDQKRIQPLLDAVEGQVKHLPSTESTFAPNGQETIEFKNWDGLLFDKVMKHYKTINPGKRSEADLPENAQPAQYMFGLSNQSDADKEMKLTPEEKNLYDMHLRNLIGPGGVDNPDGTRSTMLGATIERDGKFYMTPMVWNGKVATPEEADANIEKHGLDKFPSYATEEEANKRYEQMHKFMEKDTQNFQEAKGAYNSVVDWLQNNLKTPGQNMQDWSGKEILGYMLSTGLGVLGPGRGSVATGGRLRAETLLNGRDITLSAEPRSFLPANENIAGKGKADSAMDVVKNKPQEFYDFLASREGGSPYERALANQKAGRMNPTGDSVEDFIKGSRNSTLRLVDKNPPQEPQGRPVPSLQQRQTQEAQRAANDRNYQLGKGSDRVNVGQGKGVLNDNKEEVMAMISKGHKPSEIARRFDITSQSVQQWIKRNGPITSIEDILDK